MRLSLNHATRLLHRRRGAAAVEFAVVAALLVLLLLGIWEVGRLIHVQQILTNATREGGRAASMDANYATMKKVIEDYLIAAGLPNAKPIVSPAELILRPTGETSVKVTVTMNYDDVRWVKLYMFTSASTKVTAETTWLRQDS